LRRYDRKGDDKNRPKIGTKKEEKKSRRKIIYDKKNGNQNKEENLGILQRNNSRIKSNDIIMQI